MKQLIFIATLALTVYALPRGSRAQSPQEIAEGARVWSANCTRCHNARPSSERTDRQWETIVAHMRARANLTKGEAHVVAVFLKSTNVPKQSPPTPPPAVTQQSETSSKKVQKDPDKNQLTPRSRLLQEQVESIRQYLQSLETLDHWPPHLVLREWPDRQ